jgi:hypothetical protein
MAWMRSLLVVSFFGVMSVACTHVKVEDAKGPDGAGWKAISCSRVDKKCFDTAERMCPDGYVFARQGSKGNGEITPLPPRNEWHDEMYSKKPGKLLVRCASSSPKTA